METVDPKPGPAAAAADPPPAPESSFPSFLAYAYLLRVPLLTWLFVLLFGPLAAGAGLLKNLLLGGISAQVWTLLTALLACRWAQGAAETIVRYGAERFGVRFKPPGILPFAAAGALCGWAGGPAFLLAGLLAAGYALTTQSRAVALGAGGLALLVFVALESWPGAVLGAFSFAILAWFLQTRGSRLADLDALIWNPSDVPLIRLAVDFALFGSPAYVLGWFMATRARLGPGVEVLPLMLAAAAGWLLFWFVPWWILSSSRVDRVQAWADRMLASLLRRPLRWLRPYLAGYAEYDQTGAFVRILEGHWSLIVLDMFALGAFVWFGAAKSEFLASGGGAPPPVWSPGGAPALAFLFIGVAILCLLGSGVTFALDRFRLPLLVPFALLVVLGSRPPTDHVFPVRPPPAVTRPSAPDLLAGRDRVIVVATAGGGVQAAGWTARVLNGLAAEEPGFVGSLRAVSAVSGGSVGSMYFLRNVLDAKSATGEQARRTVFDGRWRAAVEPSLDVFAWGLINRDLAVALTGLFRGKRSADRASAFDDLLASRARLRGVWMSDWSAGAGRTLPAVIFNAFEIETGRPAVISTSSFPPEPDLVDLLARHDLPVVTAARLSSSFPFVSPVARPDRPGLEPHLADGGYFDNYGLATLIKWLRAGLKDRHVPVLLVRIVSFPDPDITSPKHVGWGYQLYAPLVGMLKMRAMSQGVRGALELEMLQETLDLSIADFTFHGKTPDGKSACSSPSLSWDLSPDEISCFDTVWAAMASQRAQVRRFLGK